MDSSIVVFKFSWRDWNLLKRSVLILSWEYAYRLDFQVELILIFFIYSWKIFIIIDNGFIGNVITRYVDICKQLFQGNSLIEEGVPLLRDCIPRNGRKILYLKTAMHYIISSTDGQRLYLLKSKGFLWAWNLVLGICCLDN